MKSEQMIALRPAEQTLDAITASLARIDQAEAAEKAMITRLNAERPETVLSGTAKEIADARAAIVEAHRTLDELADLRTFVQQRIAVVQRANTIAEDAELAQVAEAASIAFREWHAKHYAMHAKAIADGMELEKRAMHLHYCLRNARKQHAKRLEGADLAQPVSCSVDGAPDYFMFASKVRLPGIAGGLRGDEGDMPFWWPDEHQGIAAPDPGAVIALTAKWDRQKEIHEQSRAAKRL